MNTPRSRQPQGIPVGGQFAAHSHSEPSLSLSDPIPAPLRVDPSVDSEAVRALAAEGLVGEIRPYQGDDDEIPEGSLHYRSGSNSIVISGLGTDSLAIRNLSDDPHREFTMTREDNPGAAEIVEAVDAVKWQNNLSDAFTEGFNDGEDFEVRDTYLGKNGETGDVVAGMSISDHNGTWFTLDHNYTTGATTVDSESWMGEKPLDHLFVAPIVSDLTGKDVYGADADNAAAAAFAKVRARAEEHLDYEKYCNTDMT